MTLRDKRAETEPDATGQQVLSLAQQRAIELLLLGYRDAEVAAAVGVTRQTVCNWRNHNEAFQAELIRRRLELWEAAKEELRGLVEKAIKVFREALSSEDQKLRLGAAVHVLKCVGLYGHKSLDPEAEAAFWFPKAKYKPEVNPEEWDLSDILFGEGEDDTETEESPKS